MFRTFKGNAPEAYSILFRVIESANHLIAIECD